ncbi:hypothetical protein EVAR_37640_1 [Eumeta japonica]|uniref:Uncharacterized protein n=1 Tax=Eumeta variegata TaxID=151549 RepID=A0A4C1VPZ0_EUMVA|nr:hypothetical protein EVAR_37640_1 [Eumeta japonica]
MFKRDLSATSVRDQKCKPIRKSATEPKSGSRSTVIDRYKRRKNSSCVHAGGAACESCTFQQNRNLNRDQN